MMFVLALEGMEGRPWRRTKKPELKHGAFEPDRVNRALVQPDVAVVQYHAPARRLSRVVP